MGAETAPLPAWGYNMRIAVLADIHGNLPALEAVLEDVQRHGVDGTIVAGDLCDRPQPLEAVRAVHAHAAIVLPSPVQVGA